MLWYLKGYQRLIQASSLPFTLAGYKVAFVSIDTIELAAEEDPAAIAETSIEFARVEQALHQLTPAQRQVIELRFFGGLTSEEAGQVLNKSSGAVREMQSAAIKQLRRLLGEES